MDAVLKLSRQFWVEQKQPQRVNYISRELSYHGNTLGTLQISGHVTRRAPYNAILNQDNFHKVSPAYAKRFQRKDETEEQYVARLAKELEDKILELGEETVIGFIAETVVGATTGVVAAPKGYFAAMKAVCEKYDVLLILDEVMSGMGRKYFYLIQPLLGLMMSKQVWAQCTRGRASAMARHPICRLSQRALVVVTRRLVQFSWAPELLAAFVIVQAS